MYKLKGVAFGTVNNNQKLKETPGIIAEWVMEFYTIPAGGPLREWKNFSSNGNENWSTGTNPVSMTGTG